MIIDCYCGEMAVVLAGEDAIPMCLAHFCEELDEAEATVQIASEAILLASRRVRFRPIETLDSGGLL